jgi:hypothetical protein
MAKKFTVNVDGIEHEISYKKGLFKSAIIIDGNTTPIKSKNAFIQLIDEPITIGSKTMHFTAIGAKIDLAVDDVYLNSGKPYVSFGNIPSWANIIPIVLLISGWFFGGLIGILIGLLGGMIVISSSISTDNKNPLPKCIALTVVCLALQLLYFIAQLNILF